MVWLMHQPLSFLCLVLFAASFSLLLNLLESHTDKLESCWMHLAAWGWPSVHHPNCQLFTLGTCSPFWRRVGSDAVVAEADSFKETDIIYQALNSLGHTDLAATAQLVTPSLVPPRAPATATAAALLAIHLCYAHDALSSTHTKLLYN